MVSIKEIGAKFGESAEKDAMLGGIGAVLGAAAIPHTPQLVGKYSNAVYGGLLIVGGMFLNVKGLQYLMVGAGVSFLIDGAIRLIMPDLASSQLPTYTLAWNASSNYYATNSA